MKHADKTLQQTVIDTLKERIEEGELEVGDKLTPEREMSHEFGVSRTTITKALHKLEIEGWVSREQGRGTFVTNPNGLNQNITVGPTIAFLGAVPAHPSLFRYFIGLSDAVNEVNGHLRLLGSFEGLGSEREMLERALRDGADGLVIYPGPGYSAPRVYSELINQGVPIVMIDRYFPDLVTDRVTYDCVSIAQQLCGKLFDAGCKRIAVLPHHEFEVTSVRDRIEGAKIAAKERGLPANSVAIWHDVYFDFSPSKHRPDMRSTRLSRLLERLRNDHVDGMFAINGDVAERLSRDLDSLRSNGDIHESFTISSFVHQFVEAPAGGAIILAYEEPELMGREAAQILLNRLNKLGPKEPVVFEIKNITFEIYDSNDQ